MIGSYSYSETTEFALKEVEKVMLLRVLRRGSSNEYLRVLLIGCRIWCYLNNSIFL